MRKYDIYMGDDPVPDPTSWDVDLPRDSILSIVRQELDARTDPVKYIIITPSET